VVPRPENATVERRGAWSRSQRDHRVSSRGIAPRQRDGKTQWRLAALRRPPRSGTATGQETIRAPNAARKGEVM